MKIEGRCIGVGQPAFFIAEAGVNHNGDVAIAHRLVDVAADAGADAIKFQTFRADRLVTPDAPKAIYQQAATDEGESQFAMLRRLELSPQEHEALIDHCQEAGLIFLSTPFDEASADLLETLGAPAFKIPSGEVTNLPFLAHVARKNRPLIFSTGMSFLGEVETAVRAIEETDNRDLALLHCVSNYPATPDDVNLRAMQTMAQAFGYPVGYSDHTEGTEISLAAVALGACIIEKHFTLDRSLPGPDHQASMEPDELKRLICQMHRVEAALGNGRKEPAASEASSCRLARKSLVAAQDLIPGSILTREMLTTKRPGTGLPPPMIEHLLGRTISIAIPKDTLIDLKFFA